ncbi:MAG TPA: class I SAM-dependent methyltransferase [Gemmatimonadaceae bacterium]|nr:class I SAM-dependent methyltransferase [Gemmatimonadaceae bacterium]
MSDWFEEWFGEEYLELYPHRDEREARRAAASIARVAPVPPDARVLDLACGAGRHMGALAEHWWTVGLDLSPALLRVARSRHIASPLVRADMRALPFRTASFGLVVNLFTSFGYFRDDAQHQRVLDEVGRVTRPGGWFVLDYLNDAYVRATLVPRDERCVGSRSVEQERDITPDRRYVCKTIRLVDEARSFTERVRLFTPDELRAMLTRARFTVAHLFGDYGGESHDAAAPRTILVAERQ